MAGLLLVLHGVAFAGPETETTPATAEPQIHTPSTVPSGRERTDIQGTIEDSLKLLMLEHLGRIAFQEKTRRELTGPFFSDYARSVRMPGQWSDGDSWFVNYVGHPIHGAAAGYIWLDHDPNGSNDVRFGRSYWTSRGRAALWAAAYSVQFEVGPISEASIGNVGMRPETTGWVDHVITPAGAFALMVGEDLLDRSFLTWAEARVSSKFVRATLRSVITPGRALSNIASSRPPWYREGRPLDWKRR